MHKRSAEAVFFRVLAESAFLHSFIKIGIWVIMLLCLLWHDFLEGMQNEKA